MKVNRRGLFGVAAGASLAAPEATRQVMQMVDQTAPSILPGYYDTPAKLSSDPYESARTLSRLKRIAAGDIQDEDRNYPTCGNHDATFALKSVSDAGRHWMRSAKHEREWRERFIKNAIDSLNEYDKTGILRNLF